MDLNHITAFWGNCLLVIKGYTSGHWALLFHVHAQADDTLASCLKLRKLRIISLVSLLCPPPCPETPLHHEFAAPQFCSVVWGSMRAGFQEIFRSHWSWTNCPPYLEDSWQKHRVLLKKFTMEMRNMILTTRVKVILVIKWWKTFQNT